MQELICSTWQQLVLSERLTKSVPGTVNAKRSWSAFFPQYAIVQNWETSLNYFICGYLLHIKARCSAEIFEGTSGFWKRKENEVLPFFQETTSFFTLDSDHGNDVLGIYRESPGLLEQQKHFSSVLAPVAVWVSYYNVFKFSCISNRLKTIGVTVMFYGFLATFIKQICTKIFAFYFILLHFFTWIFMSYLKMTK